MSPSTLSSTAYAHVSFSRLNAALVWLGGGAEHLCKGLELLLEGVDSAVVVDVESDAEADGVQGGHGVGGVREQVRIKGEASPIVLLVPIHV